MVMSPAQPSLFWKCEKGKKQKQYYTTSDFAYFNLFSNSENWIVRGTPEHGITSTRGTASQTPCLNCYKVDDVFYEALTTLINQGNTTHEFGLVLDKAMLKRKFEVVDVCRWNHRHERPPTNECWKYDLARSRTALWPFNYCEVVRVRIPESNIHGLPIAALPPTTVVGLLMKKDCYNHEAVSELLVRKRWDETPIFEVFGLLWSKYKVFNLDLYHLFLPITFYM